MKKGEKMQATLVEGTPTDIEIKNAQKVVEYLSEIDEISYKVLRDDIFEVSVRGYNCIVDVEETIDAEPFFKLSLAQWSMHKMIREEGVDPYSFAEKAKNWGFEGLEYVSQLYDPELSDANYSEEAMAVFVEKSNAEAKKHGLKNVLIMKLKYSTLSSAIVLFR